MANSKRSNGIISLFILFIIVNSFCFLFKNWLDAKNIDHLVVIGANCILFVLSATVYYLHKKAAKNKNPHAFVRSVMAGTFIKLVVIAVAVIVYLKLAEQSKSVYAIVAGIALYFIYTIIEVKSASRLNKHHGN
jgi:heme/copper-type cytochrome/quinol oxidase subunit 3